MLNLKTLGTSLLLVSSFTLAAVENTNTLNVNELKPTKVARKKNLAVHLDAISGSSGYAKNYDEEGDDQSTAFSVGMSYLFEDVQTVWFFELHPVD